MFVPRKIRHKLYKQAAELSQLLKVADEYVRDFSKFSINGEPVKFETPAVPAKSSKSAAVPYGVDALPPHVRQGYRANALKLDSLRRSDPYYQRMIKRTAATEGSREGFVEGNKAVRRGLLRGVADMPENVVSVVPDAYKLFQKSKEWVGLQSPEDTRNNMKAFYNTPVMRGASWLNKQWHKPFEAAVEAAPIRKDQDKHIPGAEWSERIGYFIPTIAATTIPAVPAAGSAIKHGVQGVSTAGLKLFPRAAKAFTTGATPLAGQLVKLTQKVRPVMNRVWPVVDKGYGLYGSADTTMTNTPSMM